MANASVENKVTRVMALDKAISAMSQTDGMSEYIEVLEKMKASVSKRSTSKADKAKASENAGIRTAITEVLAGGKMRLTDITKAVNEKLGTDYSTNKVSAQVTKLKDEGAISRTEEKRIAYFSVA